MRIAEKSKFVFHDHPDMFVPSLNKKHSQGPLAAGNMYFPCSQLKDFTIAAEEPNHCVKIGSEVAKIGSEHSPVSSEKLDIHVVHVNKVLYMSVMLN